MHNAVKTATGKINVQILIKVHFGLYTGRVKILFIKFKICHEECKEMPLNKHAVLSEFLANVYLLFELNNVLYCI